MAAIDISLDGNVALSALPDGRLQACSAVAHRASRLRKAISQATVVDSGDGARRCSSSSKLPRFNASAKALQLISEEPMGDQGLCLDRVVAFDIERARRDIEGDVIMVTDASLVTVFSIIAHSASKNAFEAMAVAASQPGNALPMGRMAFGPRASSALCQAGCAVDRYKLLFAEPGRVCEKALELIAGLGAWCTGSFNGIAFDNLVILEEMAMLGYATVDDKAITVEDLSSWAAGRSGTIRAGAICKLSKPELALVSFAFDLHKVNGKPSATMRVGVAPHFDVYEVLRAQNAKMDSEASEQRVAVFS